MKRKNIIKFEKVSYEQFKQDCIKLGVNTDSIDYAYEHITLPTRSSVGSCGYDFYSPFDFSVSCDGYPVTVPLGIRIIMPHDYFLQIVPRSGAGIKTGVSLSNTVGIIDADYAQSSNEGHIMVSFKPGFNDWVITQQDRIVQGIIMKYYITSDDTTIKTRNGGFGSSGK